MARIVIQSDDDHLPEVESLLKPWKSDGLIQIEAKKARDMNKSDEKIEECMMTTTTTLGRRRRVGATSGALRGKLSEEGCGNQKQSEKKEKCHDDDGVLEKKKVKKRVLGGAGNGRMEKENPLLMPLVGVSGNALKERRGVARRGVKSRLPETEDLDLDVEVEGRKGEESGTSKRVTGRKIVSRILAKKASSDLEGKVSSGEKIDRDDGILGSVDATSGLDKSTRQRKQRVKKEQEQESSSITSRHNSIRNELDSVDSDPWSTLNPEDVTFEKDHPTSESFEIAAVEVPILGQRKDVCRPQEKDVPRRTGVKKSSRAEESSCTVQKNEYEQKLKISNQVQSETTFRGKPSRKQVTPARKLDTRTQTTDSTTEDDYSDCGSDGMSEFIVNDSYVSEQDDSSFISPPSPPPPRSVRRLVRGRRPRAVEDSENEDVEKTATRRLSSGLRFEGRHEFIKVSEADSFVDDNVIVTKAKTKPDIVHGRQLALDLQGLLLTEEPSRKPNTPPKSAKLTTPPSSPLLKPIKLKSPTKRFPTIPDSPHRPSMNSFWDQEAVNNWNDEYSPQKVLRPLQLDDSPIKSGLLFSPKKSSMKQDKAAKAAKKTFEENKCDIADAFLAELDDMITQGQISKLAASTGGVRIMWSNKLNTTAGRANWKRETVKAVSGSVQQGSTGITYRHHATIELASKVIDTEHRLLNVLAHEFCHLANFMISNIKTNPHGKEFKVWAAKCSRAFGARGIEVTTKHTYEIDYKYIWECENCGLEFKRHSKSIDPVKHRCGSCKSMLVQTRPVPRGAGKGELGTVKKASEYQIFVKENMSRVRGENPGSPQKDILGLVARRYKEFKATKLVLEEVRELSDSSSKEGTPDIADVGSLVRKLDFLDLKSQ